MTDTYSRDRANAALLFGYLSEAGVTPLEAAALTPADLVTRTRALHLDPEAAREILERLSNTLDG